MSNKAGFEKDEQVLVRFRGKSSAPDGVYGLLKLLEGDELYQSVSVRHRAVVALAPYVMMRDAAHQLPDGAMDEVLSRMNTQTLAVYRAMLEEFRKNSGAIEKRINQELISRSVTEATIELAPNLSDKLTFAESDEQFENTTTKIAVSPNQNQETQASNATPNVGLNSVGAQAPENPKVNEKTTDELTSTPAMVAKDETILSEKVEIETLGQGSIVSASASAVVEVELQGEGETSLQNQVNTDTPAKLVVPDMFG